MKFLAFIFNFLMLFSTADWQFNLHYCGESIASIALNAEHDGCKMAGESDCHKPTKKIKSCCEKETPTPEKKCCHDKLVKHQSIDDYQPQLRPQITIKAVELLFGYDLFFENEELTILEIQVFEDPPPKLNAQSKFIFSTQRTLFG